MEEYNSEALKTVEDIANNIPMDITNSDIHKSAEVLNDIESKLVGTYNESNVHTDHLSSVNSIGNELEYVSNNLTNESSYVSNQNEDFESSSTNIDLALSNIQSADNDSIGVINPDSEIADTGSKSVEERMDWAESAPENISDSQSAVDNNVTSKDSISESNLKSIEDTDLHNNSSLNENIMVIDTNSDQNQPTSTSESDIVSSNYKPTQDNPISCVSDLPPSDDLPESSTSEINIFSEDKDSSDQSAGLSMLEDLSEIPSESYPELEPNTEKSTSESAIGTLSSELSQSISESQQIDSDISMSNEVSKDNTEKVNDSDNDRIDTTVVTETEESEITSSIKETSTDLSVIDVSENTESIELDKDTSGETIQNKETDTVEKLTSNETDKPSTKDKEPDVSDTFESLSNDNQPGADEELCIIPDTERVISQEERDAASSIPPLRDITESSVTLQSENNFGTLDSSVTSPIVVYKCDKDDIKICNECKLKRKVKFYYTIRNEKEEELFLCDDNCLNSFKNGQDDKVVLNWEEGSLRVKNFTVSKKTPSLSFVRKCASCDKETNDIDNNLAWEIMDFCNEICLTKYQKDTGSHCSSCKGEVKSNSLGKYCVRFGNDIRQFCTSVCLEKYKKGLKVCSYCQQDMSGGSSGFLAPVGDKGQFKDFCSQVCMDKYDVMTNNRPPVVEPGTKCSVCKAEKPITIEFELDSQLNYFCGEPCFVAFSFVNNISPGKCAMCRRHFPKTVLEKHTMYYDNVQHSFCSTSCENIYIIAYRKIVPCSWCKVKKYNFDMIRRYSKTGSMINMCSVNCLSQYRVSLETGKTRQQCCNCHNVLTVPMYHLTMSDSSIRNFCSYSCAVNYQNQFKHGLATNRDVIPRGQPRKNKQYPGTDSEINQIPIISSIQSLANTNGNLSSAGPPGLTPINTRSTRSKSSSVGTTVLNSTPQVINSFSDLPFQVQIKQHFIVRPAPLPEQRNVATMCYTKKINKSISAQPIMVDQEVQTDEREAKKILIPVPVPIYVPTPMHMYSAPTPVPVPIPIPVPVPVFIPTTRNSAAGIMKELKKIEVKIQTDPYEAELLMMAEMVAEEKKEDITDSESDVDDTGGPEDSYSPEPVDASNTFGDDMLQMALKMATELDEPAVDLEGALTANTITAAQGGEAHPQNENVDDPQPMHHHMMDRSPSMRGRKRGMRQPRGGAKRGRRMSHHQVDISMMQHQVQQPPPPPEPAEKPDANMCLKYTFGVNAWKQWVTTKNTELEKSSRRVKLFKTEILQLTADELNYSLCLFVKEVRKPNGAEYAPDTIYYLCLGIQQYLFENGRIDNIFCDPYYEKFTDCLDEVAKKFSVLYNDSHYIVTRVEEEHLWESKQLGAHSPHVLLSTLMFFNTKHFNLTSVDEHMQLSFSHIMKHWKRNPNQPGASKIPGSRNVLLRFYPPQSAIQNNARKKKVYEQQENEENPLRCPVKLYEFYLSKCPESVKTRNDVFYLQPERSCVPDSPVWYSTMPLPKEALEKMLHRVKMVKEINVALLTS